MILRILLSFFGSIFSSLSMAILIGFLMLGAIFWIYAEDLPDYEQLAAYSPPTISRIYSGEGKLIDEFARERARLKRMAEREIRRRRFRRKSEPNLLTLGNLLAATKNNNANSGTRRRKSGGGVLKMTTTTTTNLDAISIQKALDSVLRDVTKASSQIETQTREFEKSGWVFGFNVGIMNKKGVRRRRGRNTSNN